MSAAKIPEDERPSAEAIGAHNRSLRDKGPCPKRYEGKFIETMKAFVSNPPAGIKIWKERAVVETERVMIPFVVEKLAAKAKSFQSSCGDLFYLMDGTFGTNVQDLVLLACGPAGVGVSQGDDPHMKCIPFSMCISDAEHQDACEVLLEQECREGGITRDRVKDVMLDGSGAFANAAHQTLEGALHHRCLQHIKNNCKNEAARVVDRVSGAKRLSDRAELLPHLLERLMTSDAAGGRLLLAEYV